MWVRLCPNSTENYKSHHYKLGLDAEGNKVRLPKLEEQIFTGKGSFFTGAQITFDEINRTEQL